MTENIEIRKADPPLNFRSKLTPLKKVDMIILHHMAHKSADIQAVHNYHRSRTYISSSGKTGYWSGIGYNYFITFDGIIYEARGLHVGAHTYGYISIGIGFQGDFQQQQIPDAQLIAGAALCSKLMQDHSLTEKDIKKHKDLAASSCPGKNFRLKDLLQHIQTPIISTVNALYCVKVGAFQNKDMAERMKQQLFLQDFRDAFIWTKYQRD